MDNQLVERLAIALERTAAATERLVAVLAGRDIRPSVRPSEHRPATKRGRKVDTDPEEDRRIHERYKASGVRKYEDFAMKHDYKPREVKLAIDRDRHRKK